MSVEIIKISKTELYQNVGCHTCVWHAPINMASYHLQLHETIIATLHITTVTQYITIVARLMSKHIIDRGYSYTKGEWEVLLKHRKLFSHY